MNDHSREDSAIFDRRSLFALGVGSVAAAVMQTAAAGAAPAALGRRRLGALEVSSIGLGCMNMAPGFYNPAPNPQDMVRVIRSAVDRGVTFFDTAEVYGPFVSERIVGKALQPVRDQVVIASKFGFQMDGSLSPRDRNSRPEHIRRAVDGMLQRLRTDRIDLLYLHRVDPQVPVEEVAETVRDLIRQGKARHFGLSEVSPDTARRAHAVQPVTAIQSEYSLLERSPEAGILDVCQELGIGFVPWGPTGRALLADGFNEYSRFAQEDRRSNVPVFAPEALRANIAVVDLTREWGDAKGVTPVQFALAWLLAERPFIVPIPGTTKLHHLEENLGALNVRITPDEQRRFRAQLAAIPVVGARPREQAFRDQ
jgi:aryl-alcohol dehydrogenase-like predicted oxidoreductase